MLSSFETRLTTLLKKLENAPACDSMEAAFDQFWAQWLQANIDHESPDTLLNGIRNRRLNAEQGWQGVGTPVCYLDCSEMPDMRLYLHSDGTIVIQHMEPGIGSILFSKPGRIQRTPCPTAQQTEA